MNPIKAIGQKWDGMSKGQKVATVAGTVAGAAAVGLTVAAGVMGKDSFHKGSDKQKLTIINGFADGFKALGGKIAEFATTAFEGIKKFFNKKPPVPPQA